MPLLNRGGRFVYKIIRPNRLHEQIVEQIERQVLMGILKPGDQMPAERELAVKCGVSRATIRCAIEALRGKGLLETRSGRGTFVSDCRQFSERSECVTAGTGRRPLPVGSPAFGGAVIQQP